MPVVQETEYIQIIKDFILNNWVDSQDFPKPDIEIVNDPDDAIAKYNTFDSDVMFLSLAGPEQVKYRGNVSYIDLTVPILVTCVTPVSRQRLYNYYLMLLGLCLTNKFKVPGWQFIRFLSYKELVNENLNLWRSEIQLQLENYALRAYSTA
jgi:hypothetical protein